MNSEMAEAEIFKEYKELGPKKMTLGSKIVLFIHIIAAIVIFVTQFNMGLAVWFYGYGIVTPILLVIHGFFYTFLESDLWYREEMAPFIARIINTNEIEIERFCQYHRIIARSALILGWIDILVCQWVWTTGLAIFVPNLFGENLLFHTFAEIIAYGVIFGPFLLYFILLLPAGVILDRILNYRYQDIKPLLEIQNRWEKENQRRKQKPEPTKTSSDDYKAHLEYKY